MPNDNRATLLSQQLQEQPGLLEFVERILENEAIALSLQPRAEFLASIPVGQDIETVVLDFLGKIDPNLALEDTGSSNEYRARGDTFLFRLKVLPPANPGLKKSIVLLILLEANDYWELETIRDKVFDTDSSGLFRDFMLVWDGSGVARSWFSYITLHAAENHLRKLVVSRLACVEDADWWDKRLRGLGGKHTTYKQREQADSEVTQYPDEILSDIFYTDLSALEKAISETKNWEEVFEEVFRTKKYIRRLSFLNRLRRKIAHNRFLTQRNQNDLSELFTQFVNACRRVWGS